MPSALSPWLTCGPCRGSNTLINKCHRTRRRFISGVRVNLPLIGRAWKVPPWPVCFCPGINMALHPQFTLLFRAEVPMHFYCCLPELQSPKLPFGNFICVVVVLVVVVKSFHTTTARGEPTVHPGITPLVGTSRSSQGRSAVKNRRVTNWKQNTEQ